MDLFKVEFYVKDKDLAKVKRILANTRVVRGEIVDHPVVNAMMKNGKLRAKTDGNTLSLLLDYLQKSKKAEINADDVRTMLQENGRNPTSYRYALTEAIKAGYLRRKGKGATMTYVVRNK